VRREVFLIFKESLNNIVKHSACSEVAIALAVEDSVLRLDVRDNGKGFDPLAPVDGHGLASLRSRASALGGTMTVVSAPGAGTAITLVLPIPT
jgi:signal transduction histidine kinase